jgi:hypothetical protein
VSVKLPHVQRLQLKDGAKQGGSNWIAGIGPDGLFRDWPAFRLTKAPDGCHLRLTTTTACTWWVWNLDSKRYHIRDASDICSAANAFSPLGYLQRSHSATCQPQSSTNASPLLLPPHVTVRAIEEAGSRVVDANFSLQAASAVTISPHPWQLRAFVAT